MYFSIVPYSPTEQHDDKKYGDCMGWALSKAADHGLMNYIDTKAKYCHLKN
jgi:hypothetical protein